MRSIKPASATPSTLPKFGKRRDLANAPANSDDASLLLSEFKESDSAASETDRRTQRAMEDDAWSDVSSRYEFATKPMFLPSFRAFRAELQRYELRWALASSQRCVLLFDALRTGREDAEGEAFLLRYCTDANVHHSLSQMLAWTRDVLGDLHTNGVAAARRSRRVIGFQVPLDAMSTDGRGMSGDARAETEAVRARIVRDCSNAQRSLAAQRAEAERDPDEDRPIRDPRLGCSGTGGAGGDALSGLEFLTLECRFHPAAPASVLYGSDNKQCLYQWATVTLSQDSSPWESATATTTTTERAGSRKVVFTVSLQTWTFLLLRSMLTFLQRNDVGAPNSELTSSLHVAKEIKPIWHELRARAGMHPAELPVDMSLLVQREMQKMRRG